MPCVSNRLRKIQNFCTAFVLPKPFEHWVLGSSSVLKVIGEKRMTVTVYARHGAKCPKSRERNTGQYKRCKCPLWLRWGKHDKKSARTRSWDIATKAARKLEQELELAAQWHRASKEARPHHHRVGCRSVLGRHGSAGDQRLVQGTAHAFSPSGLCQREECNLAQGCRGPIVDGVAKAFVRFAEQNGWRLIETLRLQMSKMVGLKHIGKGAFKTEPIFVFKKKP